MSGDVDGGVVRGELKEKDIPCLGHLRRAFELLEPPHEVGCARDTAGNRTLHFDQYRKPVLLYAWNPLIGSIRDLRQVVGLANVAKATGVGRVSLGSFSEAPRLFDPAMPRPVAAELAAGLEPGKADPRLAEFKRALTPVDGTVLPALAHLARRAIDGQTRHNTARDGRAMHGWRLHAQLDLATFHPRRLLRTGARNIDGRREARVLLGNLEPDRCHVADGAFYDRKPFDAVTDIGSGFVIRVGENAVHEQPSHRPITPEAKAAGVTFDAVVNLPGAAHPVRRIELAVEPHPRRSRTPRGGDGKRARVAERIVLTTNLPDPPAELVAPIYRYRYTVELFFRVFKQLLGMRHLLSQRGEGIDIRIYATPIVGRGEACPLRVDPADHRPAAR